jgi:peptidoglycan/xylan/chitin deacetylase (PgdA/CDA1 family)
VTAARRRPPLVLCYHAVSDAWPDPLAVSRDRFERQLRWLLGSGFHPVGVDEALSGRGRIFHVTFDDAYRNVLDVVPLLERMGVRATIFVCSRYADDGAPLLISELRTRAAGFEAELATMTWEMLGELSERGFEIGSHTATHAHLPKLDDAELRRELTASRGRIEDELGRPCRFVAYPFGESDERVRTAAAAAGYEAGFALRGPADGAAAAFAVPRVDVYRGDGKIRFALKASTARTSATRVLDRLRATRG